MNQKTNTKENGLFFVLLMVFLLMCSKSLIGEEQQDMRICFKNNNFFVRISGDINEPGTYSFPETVDLEELISTAGGLKVKDQRNQPSMDLELVSGSWVTVRQKEGNLTFTQNEIPAFYKVTLGIPININRGSIEDLTAIPGIGSSLAARIEEERIKKNGFRDLSEIRNIHGIGNTLYEKVVKYVTLR
jgi:competence protein ComEA